MIKIKHKIHKKELINENEDKQLKELMEKYKDQFINCGIVDYYENHTPKSLSWKDIKKIFKGWYNYKKEHKEFI